MVQFSSPTKVVTVTATVDTSNVRTFGVDVTNADVQAETESALRRAAQAQGASIESIEVTVTNGPRTVTLTEEEYNTLRQGAPASAAQ